MRDGDDGSLPMHPGMPVVEGELSNSVGCATLAQGVDASMDMALPAQPPPQLPTPPTYEPGVRGSKLGQKYEIRPRAFWEMIVNEYAQGGITKGDLAKKYGVSQPAVNYHTRHLIEFNKEVNEDMRAMQLDMVRKHREELAIAGNDHIQEVKELQSAWVEEAVARCYKLRAKVDEGLESWLPGAKSSAGDLHKYISAEETTDKIARRSLGLGEKVELAGGVDVRSAIAAAVQVFDERNAEGKPVDLDCDFELAQ